MTDALPRVLAVAVALALLLATASAVLLVSGSVPSRAPALRAALQLLVLCAAWLLVNSPVEGRVLWEALPRHGLTQADLLALPPLLLAAVLAATGLRG
jgi:hypothetical protein